ncbi:MAG: hypothetical protein WCW13_00935 [archaeon]|jgi:hypothetical protein
MINPITVAKKFLRRKYGMKRAPLVEQKAFRRATKTPSTPKGVRERVYKNKAGEIFTVSREITQIPITPTDADFTYRITVRKISEKKSEPRGANIFVYTPKREIKLNAIGKSTLGPVDTAPLPLLAERGRGYFQTVLDEIKQMGIKHFKSHNYRIVINSPANAKLSNYYKSFGFKEIDAPKNAHTQADLYIEIQ